MLQELAGANGACEQLSDLKSKLKAVNAALWKIEDAIREKDRKNEFDEEFVELARLSTLLGGGWSINFFSTDTKGIRALTRVRDVAPDLSWRGR